MKNQRMSMTIEGPLVGQSSVCEPILRALGEWFGIEEALVDYVKDTDVLPTFVAATNDGPAGFLTIKRHFPKAAEIHVMGILPGLHRQGIGRALLDRAEAWLCSDGVEYLQVKTLSAARPNEAYGRTRAFYTAMGFRPLEEFKTLWSEANPCLLLVKKLEVGRPRPRPGSAPVRGASGRR